METSAEGWKCRWEPLRIGNGEPSIEDEESSCETLRARSQREMEDWGLRLEINEQHSSGWWRPGGERGQLEKGSLRRSKELSSAARINFGFNVSRISFPVGVVLWVCSASWCSVPCLPPLPGFHLFRKKEPSGICSLGKPEDWNSTWTPMIAYL